jgi:hypothetical protein
MSMAMRKWQATHEKACSIDATVSLFERKLALKGLH